jgi:hypothetical protein
VVITLKQPPIYTPRAARIIPTHPPRASTPKHPPPHIYMHTHIHAHTQTPAHTCSGWEHAFKSFLHTYTCTYTHTHTHTRTHIHTHAVGGSTPKELPCVMAKFRQGGHASAAAALLPHPTPPSKSHKIAFGEMVRLSNFFACMTRFIPHSFINAAINFLTPACWCKAPRRVMRGLRRVTRLASRLMPIALLPQDSCSYLIPRHIVRARISNGRYFQQPVCLSLYPYTTRLIA